MVFPEGCWVRSRLHLLESLTHLFSARSVLDSKKDDPNALGPANLLSIMEKLPDFPNSATDLQSWWIPEFSKKPAKLTTTTGDDDEDQDDEGAGDEWWKFFEEPTKKEAVKVKSTRLHKMSTHQALYALNSHKAVFTKAWLGLLPMLSRDAESSKGLSVRVLNIMHRGVLPYLTRPVLVMDWVASCVDYGELCLVFVHVLRIITDCHRRDRWVARAERVVCADEGLQPVSVGNLPHSRSSWLTAFIGTTHRSTRVCTPSSTGTSCTSSTELDSSVSPNFSSALRSFFSLPPWNFTYL